MVWYQEEKFFEGILWNKWMAISIISEFFCKDCGWSLNRMHCHILSSSTLFRIRMGDSSKHIEFEDVTTLCLLSYLVKHYEGYWMELAKFLWYLDIRNVQPLGRTGRPDGFSGGGRSVPMWFVCPTHNGVLNMYEFRSTESSISTRNWCYPTCKRHGYPPVRPNLSFSLFHMRLELVKRGCLQHTHTHTLSLSHYLVLLEIFNITTSRFYIETMCQGLHIFITRSSTPVQSCNRLMANLFLLMSKVSTNSLLVCIPFTRVSLKFLGSIYQLIVLLFTWSAWGLYALTFMHVNALAFYWFSPWFWTVSMFPKHMFLPHAQQWKIGRHKTLTD